MRLVYEGPLCIIPPGTSEEGSLALLREFQTIWQDQPSLLANPAVQEFLGFIIDLIFEDITGESAEESEEAFLS